MKRLLRTAILMLVYLLGWPRARAVKAHLPLPATPSILLLRPDHLGDLVLTTPVLDALPNAHITMMVGPWSSEIVARHPAIHRLLTCPFPGFRREAQGMLAPYLLLFSVAKQLRRGRYDLAINLRPDFWWGAALLYLAGIPRRVGYALSPGTPFLTRALPFIAPELATVSNLRLASAALHVLGQPALPEPFTPDTYPLAFKPTPDERQWVAARLENEGISAKTPIIVIHPGTGAAVKLWRNEAWAACADALSRLTNGAQARIILSGSRSERPLLEEIAEKMQGSALLLSDMTVGQLAALLERAALVLGVDNGPLHIAVAQGTPTAQIFGPTDPRVYGPWGNRERHIVIASTYRCQTCPAIPCNRLDFSPAELPQHPCVRKVPEAQMIEAVRQLNLPGLLHI